MEEVTILGVGSRVIHPAYGDGVVIKVHKAAYDIVFMKFGTKQVSLQFDQMEVIDAIPFNREDNYSEFEKSLVKILNDYSDISQVIPLGDKWENGTMILQPEDSSLQSKEIPIETFFHKIVMVRDRLRVMEQRINAHKGLPDEDKVNLQQYITRIYGSLTTFNVLFKNKSDQFVGEKSSS